MTSQGLAELWRRAEGSGALVEAGWQLTDAEIEWLEARGARVTREDKKITIWSERFSISGADGCSAEAANCRRMADKMDGINRALEEAARGIADVGRNMLCDTDQRTRDWLRKSLDLVREADAPTRSASESFAGRAGTGGAA